VKNIFQNLKMRIGSFCL